MNISAEEYAMKRVNEFRSSFFSTSQSQSGSKTHSNMGDPMSGKGHLSSDELSDSSNHKASKQFQVVTTAAGASQHHHQLPAELKNHADQMTKLQEEMIKEDEEMEKEGQTSAAERINQSNRRNLSKSTTLSPGDFAGKSQPKLLDDGQKGMNYGSFQILDILG